MNASLKTNFYMTKFSLVGKSIYCIHYNACGFIHALILDPWTFDPSLIPLLYLLVPVLNWESKNWDKKLQVSKVQWSNKRTCFFYQNRTCGYIINFLKIELLLRSKEERDPTDNVCFVFRDHGRTRMITIDTYVQNR
jgi:hypothetical protein